MYMRRCAGHHLRCRCSARRRRGFDVMPGVVARGIAFAAKDVNEGNCGLSERRWAHQDLNLEPADYEPAALTIELWARTELLIAEG